MALGEVAVTGPVFAQSSSSTTWAGVDAPANATPTLVPPLLDDQQFRARSQRVARDADRPRRIDQFLMTGASYDPRQLKDSPLWSRLNAVQPNKVHEVCAEMWFAASPFAIDWVVDDLRAILVDGKPAATPSQAAAKFRTFTSGG